MKQHYIIENGLMNAFPAATRPAVKLAKSSLTWLCMVSLLLKKSASQGIQACRPFTAYANQQLAPALQASSCRTMPVIWLPTSQQQSELYRRSTPMPHSMLLAIPWELLWLISAPWTSNSPWDLMMSMSTLMALLVWATQSSKTSSTRLSM